MARLLTRQEAARLLGTTPQTISNWVNKGVVTGRMVDGRLMLDGSSIKRYFDDLVQLSKMEQNIRTMTVELQNRESELSTSLSQLYDIATLVNNGVSLNIFQTMLESFVHVAGEDFLNPREHLILEDLFIKGVKMSAVSERYGISRERIRQITLHALGKIAHRMISYPKLHEETKRLNNEIRMLKETIVFQETEKKRLLNVFSSLAPVNQPSSSLDLDKLVINKLDNSQMILRHLLAANVKDFPLSVRSLNCLHYADIETVGDLVRRSRNELLKFRNFGRKSLMEIEDFMDSWGLSWEMNVNYKLENNLINQIVQEYVRQ